MGEHWLPNSILHCALGLIVHGTWAIQYCWISVNITYDHTYSCVITHIAVQIEGLPSDCTAEIDVDKRDGSGEIDFVVCAKNGKFCTMTVYS